MTLIGKDTSPLDDVWVALDLETTGLSADSDEIIEVGAVKFQGDRLLDSFQTFVNPDRRLSEFILRYTGITQSDVDSARPFSQVAGSFASFVGAAPIVGHNVAFDMGFLDKKGLRLPNPRCDTWDLAFVLLPGWSEYSLQRLAARMSVEQPHPHRALDDARATWGVFLNLHERLSELGLHTLAEMQRLSARSPWVLSYVLRRLEAHKIASLSPLAGDGLSLGARSSGNGEAASGGGAGVSGIDASAIAKRLKAGRALRPDQETRGIDVDFVASLLQDGGAMSRAIPEFEERPEQVAMARAVAEAINEGKRLIVEAGTGVGKSLAYLLPAALYALKNNKRVVVSTNTINLQEQLLTKDVPLVVQALEGVDGDSSADLTFTQLKGRANYLCLRRWHHLRSNDAPSENEARLLAKTLVWLQSTSTGDRSELNLANRSAGAPWERLSAQAAPDCQGVNGVCFLRTAREKAAASHVVIINHALLLSDLTAGGTVIPDYDVLIIDEAHHLEQEATRHLGFELQKSRIDDQVQSLTGDQGVFATAVTAFRGSTAAAGRRATVEQQAVEAAALVPRVRENVAKLFASLAELLRNGDESGRGQERELSITSGTRAQPGWSALEIQWENVDVSLSEVDRAVQRLGVALEGLEDAGLLNYDRLTTELTTAIQANADLRLKLTEVIPHPSAESVYWITRDPRNDDVTLHAAPLHVGEILNSLLFAQKDCVVMTSATLSANGTFDHVRERTSFTDADELLLGSPFDYPKAALLCVPDDMPEPSSWAYQPAVEQAVTDAAIAAGGRTMALFTSHASLQATASAIRSDLQGRGIAVLAQGVDGSPQQLVRRFLDDPTSVLLGTASFWEGVDLPGESLKVLLVARLPFSVPTEPVFAARSQLYEDPFYEYAVPQSVLRLRQGFGRLIRTKFDRGVAIILDRRIVSRKYGKSFIDSLPPVTVESCGLNDLGAQVKRWIEA